MLFEGMHPVAYVAVRAAMLEKSIGHFAARRYAEKRKAGVLYWLATSLQTGDQSKFEHYKMLRGNHGSVVCNRLVDVDVDSNSAGVRFRGIRVMVNFFQEGRRPWHLPAQLASLGFFACAVLNHPWR